jgi:hypothetical protein
MRVTLDAQVAIQLAKLVQLLVVERFRNTHD